jgi:MFS family permease
MTLPGFPWKIFWLLLIAGILGVAAVIPYLFSLLGSILPPLPIPWPVVAVLQLMQSAVLLALAIGFGLLIARRLGLGAPLLEKWLYTTDFVPPRDAFRTPLFVGAMLGALVALLARFVFLPRLPQLAAISEAKFPLWQRLLACFYGAFDEELLMRLFLLSFVIWLIQKIVSVRDTQITPPVFWSSNLVVALLFGLGHLPIAITIMSVTPLLIAAIVSLNAVAALGFGYLYWKRGIEAAMLAHFSADIILHVCAPAF